MSRKGQIAAAILGLCTLTVVCVWIPMIVYIFYVGHTRGWLDDSVLKWLPISMCFVFGPIIVAKVAIEFLDGGMFNQ